jgi:site-specific DNA recombinase
MKKIRCAIYTRKSSEDGLEQDFNSLDAQREACAAYVLSQASEGWQLLPEHYDDGGLSGGTLERPALQRLLAEVQAGAVDIIVVYKVDRLTRSLLDFAKLVEALDKAETSFVSVTQSFNTTTSMGRLTLNMLLSFAQFEREVTAERIRDKISASKAKGMWMGGTPPLGFKPNGRSLAIVEEHAAIVRDIYTRYLELGSVRALAEQLVQQGIGAPKRQRISGSAFGGVAFTRGQLYAILKNPVYAGLIVHKDKVFEGQHEALIAKGPWDEVQRMLATHLQGSRQHYAANNAALAGKLIGPQGEPLISTHATKGTVRYRYYVSRGLHHEGGTGVRLPAREIEGLLTARVAMLFEDPLDLVGRLRLDIMPGQLAKTTVTCEELAVTLRGSGKRDVAGLVRTVRVGERQVEIDIDTALVAGRLGLALQADAPTVLTLTEQVRLTRTGKVLRLLDQNGCAPSTRAPDEPLLKMVCQARAWWATLAQGELNVDELAARENMSASRLSRLLRLAFLSPALTDAVLDGTMKPIGGRMELVQPGALPACWREQDKRYLAPARA